MRWLLSKLHEMSFFTVFLDDENSLSKHQTTRKELGCLVHFQDSILKGSRGPGAEDGVAEVDGARDNGGGANLRGLDLCRRGLWHLTLIVQFPPPQKNGDWARVRKGKRKINHNRKHVSEKLRLKGMWTRAGIEQGGDPLLCFSAGFHCVPNVCVMDREGSLQITTITMTQCDCRYLFGNIGINQNLCSKILLMILPPYEIRSKTTILGGNVFGNNLQIAFG